MRTIARCRAWLQENPGWHFSTDVCEGLRAESVEERGAIARGLLQASKAKRTRIERLGTRRNYRYRWPT